MSTDVIVHIDKELKREVKFSNSTYEASREGTLFIRNEAGGMYVVFPPGAYIFVELAINNEAHQSGASA